MLTPRDLRVAWEQAHERCGSNPPESFRAELWQAMRDILAERESHQTPAGSVELVVSGPSHETIDWIDDQVCHSFAAGSRRLRTITEHHRPHGDEAGRRYHLRSLRVPRFETSTGGRPDH